MLEVGTAYGMPGYQGGPSPARPGVPRAGWPERETLLYVKDAITALLLILALPWVAYKLITKPDQLFSAVGRKAATP